MKEIKYRGKAVDGSGWRFGSLVESKLSWKNGHPHRMWIIGSAFSNGGWLSICGRKAVINETVGQFIGAHDSFGREIFEGDIVEFGGDFFEIKYIEKYARFAPVKPETVFSVFALDQCCIVGNIHDNPKKWRQ